MSSVLISENAKEVLFVLVLTIPLLEIASYLILIILDAEIGITLFAICISIYMIISIIIILIFAISLQILLTETIQQMSEY